MNLNQIFSEFVLLQSQNKKEILDLSLNAPLLELLHPKMAKNLLGFMIDPKSKPEEVIVLGWSYEIFSGAKEAQNAFKGLTIKKGSVAELGIFIHSETQEGLFDFAPFGVAYLCRGQHAQSNLSTSLAHYVLPSFLCYALSNDLWGPQGKWTRFHQRLDTLFAKYNLLSAQTLKGKYPLKLDAQKLENFGIRGSVLDGTYLLTLPWTFALSDLEKLEKIIIQEF